MTPYEASKARVRAGAEVAHEAERLVARMTVSEKLACLDGDGEFWSGLIDMVSGGYYRHAFPAAVVPRLGFPGFRFCDGPRGVVVGPSTCFPVTMARGASFDPSLEERIGEAMGVEARIQEATLFAGVCVNLLRHPAWGRAQETYGEDPHHVGEMGAALTRGVQRNVMACVKHFACNSIENSRFKLDVRVDPVVLDAVYLPHFRRIVDEGVAVVMSAYNRVNGVWCGENAELLGKKLREEWRFDGFVISDFVYGFRDPVGSVCAGLDVEMPFRQQRAGALADALDSGALRMTTVDRCVANVVRTVLRFDAGRPDGSPDPGLLACERHRALAREAAAAGTVLLRNEDLAGAPILPLDPSRLRRVAVLGRLADVANTGDGGSSNVYPPEVITPMAGLEEALPGVEWVEDPADADVAICVVGYTKDDEGEFTAAFDAELFTLMPPAPDDSVFTALADAVEKKLGMAAGGDRRSLRLRSEDEQLIAEVSRLQPRTVVVVMAGSAVVVEPWIDLPAAVLQVWYPGMEGGRALADVLLGRADPGGRLPFAVPRDESHLPTFDPDAAGCVYDAWHGQWLLDRDGHSPRFPFGFGLSYGRFELRAAERGKGCVRVEVANTGTQAGSTVVFLFRPEGAVRRLVGFCKVALAAGASGTVRISNDLDGPLVVAQHARDPDALTV